MTTITTECLVNETVVEQNPHCETTTTQEVTTTTADPGTTTTEPETTTSFVPVSLPDTTTEAPATTAVPTGTPANQLAMTGISVTPLILIAVVLIAVGAALVRRRSGMGAK